MNRHGPVEVALGLGSNVGDKTGHIARALGALELVGLVGDLERSALYRTAPWGPVAQDWFVNACCVGRTALPPEELLARIKALEFALGRIPTERWGPRVIDIDILYYGEAVLASSTLTVPHPELARRCFVLVPLAELRPERRVGGVPVRELAAGCASSEVERIA